MVYVWVTVDGDDKSSKLLFNLPKASIEAQQVHLVLPLAVKLSDVDLEQSVPVPPDTERCEH